MTVRKRIKPVICFILAFFAAVSLAVAASGCHRARKVAVFVLPDAFDESRNYEIVFWAKNDTNIDQRRIYEAAVKEFEKIYPNIKVTMKSSYTDYARIFQDVKTNIQTRTTPDVCITYPDHVATYLTADNLVVPLDALVDNEKYGLGGSDVKFESVKKEEIADKFLEECRINGALYALPFMRSTEALYINKTYVEKMGFEIPDTVTWEWIWDLSEKALEKGENSRYKVNGQETLIPFIYKSTDNMMITMLKQKNAGYSDSRGNVLIFNDTTREILKEVAVHGRSGAFSTFKISSYPGNYFNAGRCIFAVDSTAGATWIGSKSPLSDIHESEIVSFETAVRPVPQYDPEDPKMISQGPSLCLFNNGDSGRVVAAWLFMQYLLTNRVQIDYSKTEGYVPVTTKAYADPEYIAYLESADEDSREFYSVKIDAAKMLLDNIDNSFITPVFDGSTSLRTAAGDLIEYAVKAERRGQTVGDGEISEFFDRVVQLQKLDQIVVTDPDGQGAGVPGKQALPPMRPESVALLVSLASVWVIIGVVMLISVIRNKTLKKRQG